MPGRHNWRHRFRAQCSRWTLPRESILDVLSRTSRHMSAKDIYGSLYAMNPGIGLTTVYRTLELLSRLGLVHKVATADGQARYALRKGDEGDHHHHLICTKCGKIIDYRDFMQEELDLVRKTEEALARKHNFVIKDHNIEFLGLCEKCR
ncbi:MAG: ferric uptake regulation protein [Candidatus Aminicenantes bacterium RBG_13_62_12]|nr:MAG: ferric uptake regulation protein [Candidatus Aminicenantes bacterium RBG_13_62_12]